MDDHVDRPWSDPYPESDLKLSDLSDLVSNLEPAKGNAYTQLKKHYFRENRRRRELVIPTWPAIIDTIGTKKTFLRSAARRDVCCVLCRSLQSLVPLSKPKRIGISVNRENIGSIFLRQQHRETCVLRFISPPAILGTAVKAKTEGECQQRAEVCAALCVEKVYDRYTGGALVGVTTHR